MKYQKGTFVTVPNIQSLQDLPPTAQALFMWLCSYSDSSGECYPSRSVLAKNLHCSVRSIDAHLNNLIEAGFIKKENRFSGNEKTSNLYQIMLIEVEQNMQGGSAKSAPPLEQNLHHPSAKSAHRTKPTKPNPVEPKVSDESATTQKFSPEVYGMVDLLTGLIKRNNPDWQMRGTVESWAGHIDKLHRIDGRTFEQIAYMIKWTQHDQFWSQNILSTEKLREKFNDLIPKLKASAVKLQNERVASNKPKML